MILRAAAALAIVLATAGSARPQDTPPAADPVATACPDVPLRQYMTYVYGLHSTTHTDGWNLDAMPMQGWVRRAVQACGDAITAAGSVLPATPIPPVDSSVPSGSVQE